MSETIITVNDDDLEPIDVATEIEPNVIVASIQADKEIELANINAQLVLDVAEIENNKDDKWTLMQTRMIELTALTEAQAEAMTGLSSQIFSLQAEVNLLTEVKAEAEAEAEAETMNVTLGETALTAQFIADETILTPMEVTEKSADEKRAAQIVIV